MTASYETILVEAQGRVGLIRLNRPKALNVLSDQLMAELGRALLAYDADPAIAAIVHHRIGESLRGGTDIREMQGRTYFESTSTISSAYGGKRVTYVQKPSSPRSRAWRWVAAASWR